MGIVTLSANTASQIVYVKNYPRIVRISSDSTTVTRICKNEDETVSSTGGEILTAYQDKTFLIPIGGVLFAISTGTPNISVSEV